jgi:chemotaxis protein CheX
MDHAKLHELLIKSTADVFETMSFLDVVAQPDIKDNQVLENLQVSAMVSLAGEISGYLAMHCTRSFAVQCVEIMADGQTELLEKEWGDTVCEIANMIAGSFKRHMSPVLDLFEISLPTLFCSDGHRLYYVGAKEDFPRYLIPFSVSDEPEFYIELLFHKR